MRGAAHTHRVAWRRKVMTSATGAMLQLARTDVVLTVGPNGQTYVVDLQVGDVLEALGADGQPLPLA